MVERRRQAVTVVVERRKRGRKPLAEGDPSVEVSLRLPGSVYDRLYARAAARRVTLSELLRLAIAANIP